MLSQITISNKDYPNSNSVFQDTKYIDKLKKRISRGYYSSDKVVSLVTEKLAKSFDNELNKYFG